MSTLRVMALLMLVVLFSVTALAQGDPETLSSLRAEREAAEARDRARLSELLDDREALEAALERSREAHRAAQERHAALSDQREIQAQHRDELEARQQEQGSDLAAILELASRHTGELRDALNNSWVAVGEGRLPERLDTVSVLELEHLESFADRLLGLVEETGRVVQFEAPVAGTDGEIVPRDVVRLGDFAAFTDDALLRRGVGEAGLAVVERTPRSVAKVLAEFHAGERRDVALDPTHGDVIAALAQQPTLLERFHQGGVVGYVVVTLGAFGLLVGLLQYGYLLWVSLAMRRQLAKLSQLRSDNPLGRVLQRFRELQANQIPEALEARLDEAVLAELPRLERGQPLVKLLAAIAPLLGLLGTVTGMIVTFQAITVYGTGDPQLMAGGISQALVTTVLGLVTAVPLLFMHTALSGRSRHLTGVVEGQASAALARHLETGSLSDAPTSQESRSHDSALA
ncbi:MotA/TolQ/ExbB proton channel family protein [Halomonas sp. ML-15]|uniref:MotA/TolQ/ExbB proton channel family protein n=1 Tax=Halomonas sp. ML-15 TaxID=2773305 RepID=UPI001745FD27|nr:MotA/TolQ/ExbB proton channel family protein [Halomonas sp. ML-15]MBD3897469.1 MotA/TolQ/ExbB proton channel family protein [Halomonas sp. ML-15]